MTSKGEGCSECQVSVEIGCNKPVSHTAVSFFTKLGIYCDEERKGHPRKTSAVDEPLMTLTVKRPPASSYENQFNLIKKG